MRKLLPLVICALLLVGGATDAMSQQFTGGVRGSVRDAQGIIPGVTVTLTNEGTTVARDTITNEVGEYNFPAVPPATYTVRTSLPGYKTFEQRGLTIGTQQFVTLDLVLEVGTVEEEITVTADAPLIETSNASTGDNLDREILETLPAPGRNAFLVAVTIPTVTPVGDPQFNRQQDQSNASRVSLGGGGVRANNYLLDGVPIGELTGRAVLNPTIEALADVKVQVHTYDAEMGRTGGGVFNVTGRIGTNEFHGSGFYQTRPVWGQALNYFTDQEGGTKESSGLSDAYYRLYGGGGGGALWQNRTFFWYGMEGYRSFTTRFQQRLWAGPNQKNGDFSQSTVGGVPVRIWNPYCRDGVANSRCPATGSGSLATPEFTGAVIPANHPARSTVAGNINSLWPTNTVSGRTYAGNEDGEPNAKDNSRTVDLADMYTIKAEHKFTDNWSLSGMYLYNKTDEPAFDYIGPTDPKEDFFFNGATWYLERRPHVVVFNNTNIINDTTVLTTRYGWTTWLDNTIPGVAPLGPAELGFASSYASALDPTGQTILPRIRFQGDVGTRNIGKDGKTQGRRWSAPFAINVAFSKLAGSHTFKIGGDARQLGLETPTRFRTAGSFDFDDRFTMGPGGIGGHEYASFLLGAVESGEVDFNRGKLNVFTRYYSGYFQDDWRVNSRFTFNWGVRFEHEKGLSEKDNQITVAFDESVRSPLNDAVNANGVTVEQALGQELKGGLIFAGVNGAPTFQGNLAPVRISPRVGATYSLDDDTVLRMGYGLFYAPWQYSTSSHGQIGFTRSSQLNQISNDNVGVPITTLDDPFPDGLQTPIGSGLGLLTGIGANVSYVDQNKGDPKVHQYSIDLQRELPGNMAVTLGYTGATGRDIGFCGEGSEGCTININQIRPAAAQQFASLGSGWDPDALNANVDNPFRGAAGAGEFINRATISAGQLLRPFPQFGNLQRLEQTAEGKRQYNAFIFKLDKRTAGSWWGGRFSYTFSSTKDNQWGESNGYASRTATPQNYYDMQAEYGPSIFESPHRLILAPIVRIPGPGEDRPLANAILGGWSMSAIVQFVSGAPLNVVATGSLSDNNLGLFGGRQRPNLVGDANTSGSDTARVASEGQSGARWFAASAYTDAGKGQYGNAPRTNVDARYQFRKNVDFVLAKDTEIGGGAVAQVRFELLNLTNTPKFGGATNTFNTSSFGRITQQVGFMRIWQLSFRLTY